MHEHIQYKSASTRSLAIAAAAVGALSVGALALGALAIGALAIRKLAVGRVAVGRAKFKFLEIDDLRVKRLSAAELTVDKSLRLPDSQGKV